MNQVLAPCVAGFLIATLGACAAPGPEEHPAAGKPQAAVQGTKKENCAEITGSRIPRCGDAGSDRTVSSSVPDPDSFVSPPARGWKGN
jgi:predicted small lipoprotein YifL